MADLGDGLSAFYLLGVDDEIAYSWFHDGRGTQSIDANADGWKQVRDDYQEVLFLVAQALAESKASWTGAAADATHDVVSPVRAWVERALDSAVIARATVKEQSAVFSDVRAQLSPPVTVPAKPWLNDMWPGETNYDKALQAKQANSIRNVELVRQYGDMTDANNVSYPSFEEPVVVTTDVARQPEQPIEPRDRGIVEWTTGPRRDPGGGGPVAPGPPDTGPGQPAQPSTVDSSPRPGSDQPLQPVDPSQAVPSGPPPVVGQPLPVGQDPASVRSPLTGVPVAGLPGGPGSGAPAGPGTGARAPGERGGPSGGRPGGGGAPGEPGSGGRSGGGPGGRATLGAEAVAGRGAATATARGGAGQPGFVPGAGRAAGDEDAEHTNKFGPVIWHDDFWEAGVPRTAPPTIGGPDDQ